MVRVGERHRTSTKKNNIEILPSARIVLLCITGIRTILVSTSMSHSNTNKKQMSALHDVWGKFHCSLLHLTCNFTFIRLSIILNEISCWRTSFEGFFTTPTQTIFWFFSTAAFFFLRLCRRFAFVRVEGVSTSIFPLFVCSFFFHSGSVCTDLSDRINNTLNTFHFTVLRTLMIPKKCLLFAANSPILHCPTTLSFHWIVHFPTRNSSRSDASRFFLHFFTASFFARLFLASLTTLFLQSGIWHVLRVYTHTRSSDAFSLLWHTAALARYRMHLCARYGWSESTDCPKATNQTGTAHWNKRDGAVWQHCQQNRVSKSFDSLL